MADRIWNQKQVIFAAFVMRDALEDLMRSSRDPASIPGIEAALSIMDFAVEGYVVAKDCTSCEHFLLDKPGEFCAFCALWKDRIPKEQIEKGCEQFAPRLDPEAEAIPF